MFFIDVDRHAVRAVAPSYEYLVDYRALLYAGVIALIVYINKTWLLGVLYILAFPIILVVWKIPAFFVRRKSWPLFLGTLQAIFTALGDFRFNFVSKVLALFAAVFILTLDADGILAASLGYLVVLLGITYVRMVKKTVKSPSFVRVQREKIGALINSEPIQKRPARLSEDARREDVEVYSSKQLIKIDVMKTLNGENLLVQGGKPTSNSSAPRTSFGCEATLASWDRSEPVFVTSCVTIK